MAAFWPPFPFPFFFKDLYLLGRNPWDLKYLNLVVLLVIILVDTEFLLVILLGVPSLKKLLKSEWKKT